MYIDDIDQAVDAVRQNSRILPNVADDIQRDVVERIIPDAPVVPNIHMTVWNAIGERGDNLNMCHWHSECGTTHCRAGWVVTLAVAEAGVVAVDIEVQYGTALAAAAIYFASDPAMQTVPDFYANFCSAYHDIQYCAMSCG